MKKLLYSECIFLMERSKATRVMRLMEKGEVDGKHWVQVCKQLRGNL